MNLSHGVFDGVFVGTMDGVTDVGSKAKELPWLLTGLLATLVIVHVKFTPFAPSCGNALVQAPFVGPHTFFARWFFFRNAWKYIMTGYEQFGGSMYKVSGDDILVLPRKYVDELRNLPDSLVSSIQANIDNFEGESSMTSLLLEGTLHTYTIQHNLTPKLATLVPKTQRELDQVIPKELHANSVGYTENKAFELVLRLVSHIAARHFVGYPTCEKEEWLRTALQYTENVFKTIIFLRIFPDWLKPFVRVFLPFSYKASGALTNAKKIIVPLINERRRIQSSDASAQKPTDFLQMMMDNSNEFDGQPDKLAHRLLILTLAAVHTTSMAATQTLYDLCAHPEYVEILREEIRQVQHQDIGFQKQSLTKMKKLDSFMRESQRLNPPSLLGFKRAIRQEITLSDGLVLPKDAHIMMPIYPIVIDPAFTTDPMTFDGLRHYQARQRPGEQNKHQFATTSNTNMHFGHGKFACPGRFFAANSIKLILATLLLRYDFGFREGQTRPPNIVLHEYVFPNPFESISFKLRTEDEDQSAQWQR